MKKHNVHGYITTYFALSLGIIIILITTMIEGVRIHTVRFCTECAMDIGMDSVFAEYHREMLKQYKLLFIDSSYGSSDGDITKTKSHLLHYLNINLDNQATLLMPSCNLISTHADNASLSGISLASDNCGDVLRYQIVQYMKEKSGLNLLPIFDSHIDPKEVLQQYDQYDNQRSSSHDAVDNMLDEINSNLEPEQDPYSISNPADAVESLSESNALFYAIGDTNNLQTKSVYLNSYYSHRDNRSGVGLRNYQNAPNSISDKELFVSYLFHVLGYYSETKTNSNLTYQIEYLLAGKANDIENMEYVADRIFRSRYVINMSYLLSDSSKIAEAEALAISATAAIGHPELAEAVKYTILFAWGYAESAKDLRILYDGHKLPLTKSAASWNTPLEQMPVFKEYLSDYSIPSGTMAYSDYLFLYINEKSATKLTERLMDIMEMDIRLTPGNSLFRIDNLIYQLTATVNLSDSSGYGCTITRSFSYE